MKKFLITGGAGFIGSHLAEALLKTKNEVVIVDDLSTGKMNNINHLLKNSKFTFIRETIMNEPVMDRLISECDMIYHLASSVGVKRIINNPVDTIERCVFGTHTVLKIANRYQKKILFTSTSEVYGKNGRIPFSEEDDMVLGPTVNNRWSYATSKAIDEFLALAYNKESNLPVIIVRLFNTVGPRQTGQYGMVVPRFVNQAINNEDMRRRIPSIKKVNKLIGWKSQVKLDEVLLRIQKEYLKNKKKK